MLALGVGAIQYFPELIRELSKFEARDFEPAMQTELLLLRASVPEFSYKDWTEVTKYLQRVLEVLKCYRGEGSSGVTRKFPYLTDQQLQSIVERDYIELRLKVYPSGAWKSAVILAGSLLEAILHDLLSNPVRADNTNSSPRAPKRKDGTSFNIITEYDHWKLFDLIEVAADIKLIQNERAKSIDQVLRDYRNFVHPNKEVRSKHECSEAEAMMSVGALDGVCNHFEETHKHLNAILLCT